MRSSRPSFSGEFRASLGYMERPRERREEEERRERENGNLEKWLSVTASEWHGLRGPATARVSFSIPATQ